MQLSSLAGYLISSQVAPVSFKTPYAVQRRASASARHCGSNNNITQTQSSSNRATFFFLDPSRFQLVFFFFFFTLFFYFFLLPIKRVCIIWVVNANTNGAEGTSKSKKGRNKRPKCSANPFQQHRAVLSTLMTPLFICVHIIFCCCCCCCCCNWLISFYTRERERIRLSTEQPINWHLKSSPVSSSCCF